MHAMQPFRFEQETDESLRPKKEIHGRKVRRLHYCEKVKIA
jgi:hypothetical protein